MGITLQCGCTVTDEGGFELAAACRNCAECRTIAETHPFGMGRLADRFEGRLASEAGWSRGH